MGVDRAGSHTRLPTLRQAHALFAIVRVTINL